MIRNIQALRFLAAFAVMAYHAGNQYLGTGADGWLAPGLRLLRSYGMAGVDVFFVISGFIIWHTTARKGGPEDAATFLMRRLARIYFGYWPWLAIAAAIAYAVTRVDFATYNLAGSLFLFPLGGSRILIVAWTLTVEVACYALFSLLMLLPRAGTLAALLASACGVLGVWVLGPPGASGAGGLVLAPYLAEFAAGATLAAAIGRFGAPRIGWSILALLAALSIAVALHSETVILDRVLFVGPVGVAMVALAVSLETRGVVAGRWLVLLGDASYALYLCHLPLILGAMYLWWRALDRHADLMFAGMMAASVLISVIWYLAVERHVTAATSDAVSRLLGRTRRSARVPERRHEGAAGGQVRQPDGDRHRPPSATVVRLQRPS